MSMRVSTNASWNVKSVPLFLRIVLSLKLLLQVPYIFIEKMIMMEILIKVISLLIQYKKGQFSETPQHMNSLLPVVG